MNARSIIAFTSISLGNLIAPSAFAADLTVVNPAVAGVIDVSQTWSGPYVGGQIGFSRAYVDDIYPPLPAAEADGYINGAFGGIFAGVNMQMDSVVLGFDADLNIGGAKGGTVSPLATTLDTTIHGSASVRGRVGFAFENVLLYGAAGLAAANVTIDNAPFATLNDVMVGWTVGLGADIAFSENWFGRAEYRYSDYGKREYLPSADAAVTAHAVAVGVGYRF